MVKKLFKHEFMALGRMLVPMYIILLALSVLTRFIVFFETNSIAYDIISTSSIVMLVIGIFVGLIYTIVASIIRFYKNLFTKEGYLSFTLPVSMESHIFTKLVTSVVGCICTLIVIFTAGCIATSGELLVEIFKAAGYICRDIYSNVGADFTFYIIELAVLLLVSTFAAILLYYACICIGQLAKRSRILLALGAYFGYYFITQTIGTIGMVLLAVFEDSELIRNIMLFIEDNPRETLHISLIGGIVLYAVLGGVYYLVAHSIMKKRLNLE